MAAHVVNIGQESDSTVSSKSTQSIVVRHLQRPGAGRAALAFGLNGRFNELPFNEEEQAEEDADAEETLEWTDVLTRQWRVIKLSFN